MNRTRTSSLDAFGLRDQRNRIYPALEGSDGRTLDLDFTTGVLDSRITFSRASTTSTYINSSGYVTTASTNIPRFDYNPTTLAARGLLIEGSATNLAKYSETLNQGGGVWYGAAFNTPTIASGIADPSNGSNTWKAVATSGSAYHGWRQNLTYTAASYTFSIWAKAAEYDRIVISDLGSGRGSCTFVLTGNGTATPITGGGGTPVGTITAYPNGWYRCSITMTMTAATYGITIGGYPTGATTNEFGATYNADGTSGVYLWGYQIELGSGASSYIPTGASQVTRNADDASMTGTAFSSWFNASSGTMQANFRRRLTSTTGRMVSANDNTANNWIELGASTTGRWAIQQGGASQANIAPGTVAANTDYKIAGAYDTNDAQAALGGTLGTADTSVTVPTVDRLFIGRDSGASPVYLDGTISRLIYWPFRQPNATLQSLTQ
jgi:hypothetical protein